MGGIFGAASRASFYPEPQEIFLQEVWQLDESGAFVGPVRGSRGVLLRRDDVEVIELLTLRARGGTDVEEG
jgi:hypothetical protein